MTAPVSFRYASYSACETSVVSMQNAWPVDVDTAIMAGPRPEGHGPASTAPPSPPLAGHPFDAHFLDADASSPRRVSPCHLWRSDIPPRLTTMKTALFILLLACVSCTTWRDDDYPHDMYCAEDGGEWDHDRHCCAGPSPSKYDVPCEIAS